MRSVTAVVLVALLGFAAHAEAKKKVESPFSTPGAFQGKKAREAAAEVMQYVERLELDPDEQARIGGYYLRLGDEEKGDQRLTVAISRAKDDANAYLYAGLAWAAAGKWDKAEPLFDKLFKMDPDDDDNYIDVGTVYLRAGKTEKAAEYFARGLAMSPDSVGLHLKVVDAYMNVVK